MAQKVILLLMDIQYDLEKTFKLNFDQVDINANIYANELVADGATHLVVACTEFSLLGSEIVSDATIVDSLDVLTQAAVSFAKGR